MRYRTLLFSLLVVTRCGSHGFAQMHVPEPAVNLGDTSFLDAVGGPGILLETIGDGENGFIVNGSGRRVPGGGQVNSIGSLTHLAWTGRSRFVGAWYGAEVVITEAHVNAGADQTAGGFGDLTISPLNLQWNESKIGSVVLHQRLVVDFVLPVGAYSPDMKANVSSHAYSANPHYEITVQPVNRIETSWRFHYLWSTANSNPPTSFDAQSIQAGQAIHFNGSLSYKLAKRVWLGGNGYFLKQVSDPKINGISIENSPEQVGAIGPGLVWNHGRWAIYVSGYHEFEAENRPRGDKVVIRLMKVFGNEKQ